MGWTREELSGTTVTGRYTIRDIGYILCTVKIIKSNLDFLMDFPRLEIMITIAPELVRIIKMPQPSYDVVDRGSSMLLILVWASIWDIHCGKAEKLLFLQEIDYL